MSAEAEGATVNNLQQEEFVATLQNMVRPLPVGVCMKDPARGFEYVLWNRGMERLYGYTAEEVVGREDEDIFGPEVAEAIRTEDVEVLRRRGLPLFSRPRSAGRGAGPRFVQHAKFLLDSDRRLIVSFVTDVSNLVASKQELRDAREWQGLLFSLISHDVQTPLVSMTEIIDDLAENIETMAAEERAVTLSLLQAGAHRTRDLVENLLAWAHSGDGMSRLETETLDLAALADRAGAKAEVSNRRRIGVEAPEHLTVVSNRVALEAIIRNLLSNASEHAAELVRLTVEEVEGSGRAVITVANDGRGMPPSYLQPLNEGRLPDSLTGSRMGRHGLGLKLCLSLSEKIGGRLTFGNLVENDKDEARGTCVRLELPYLSE